MVKKRSFDAPLPPGNRASHQRTLTATQVLKRNGLPQKHAVGGNAKRPDACSNIQEFAEAQEHLIDGLIYVVQIAINHRVIHFLLVMSIEVLFLYLATWSLVALTPGPAAICSMSQAARYGFRAAGAGILGILCGHFVFFGCVACGLATLLAAASTAFTVLRLAGAIYLCYLGVRTIASTFRHTERAKPVVRPPPSERSLWLQGFAIQVTNPKALLFMSALLPQFIQPQHSLAWQLADLLTVTIIVDGIVLSAYARFASRGAERLRASRITAWLERAFGAILILFGVRLLAHRS